MAKHGPKPREWTDQERLLVRYMTAAGVPQDAVARAVNTTGETLRKHFRNELDDSINEIKAMAMGQLVSKIKQGNTACILFYLKTQCGFKETQKLEHSGEVTPVLRLVLPDEPDERDGSRDLH